MQTSFTIPEAVLLFPRALPPRLAALATAALFCACPAGPRPHPDLDSLADQAYRPLEARLSLPLGFAACEPIPSPSLNLVCNRESLVAISLPTTVCSPRPARGTLLAKTLVSLERWTGHNLETEDPALLHDRALLSLLRQDSTRGIEAAVARLEQAQRATPLEPTTRYRVLVDLSAAYLRKAELEQDPESLAFAYERAEEARALAPSRPEALFNCALALTRLGVEGKGQVATQAWDAYLAVDDQSPWAAEAERHRQALRKRASADDWSEVQGRLLASTAEPQGATLAGLIASHRQRVREWIEEALLPQWSRQIEAGLVPEAESTLHLLEVLATALESVTGDSFPREATAAARAASRRGGASLRTLARGHREYAAALELLYGRWHLEQARQNFAAAQTSLEAAESPFAYWARLGGSLTRHYQLDYRAVEEELAALAQEAPARYPALKARIAWIRGLARSAVGELQPAAEQYETAALGFCRLAEVGNVGSMQSLMSSIAHRQGNGPEAWRLTRGALAQLRAVFNSTRRHALWEDAIINTARQGDLPLLGLALTEEHLAEAQGSPSRQVLSNANLHRAHFLAQLGDGADSALHLERAAIAGQEVESPELKLRIEAEGAINEARQHLQREPERTVRLTTQTIDAFSAIGVNHVLLRAYALRSEALRTLGRESEAAADLAAELQLIRLARAGLPEGRERALFAASARAAVEQLVALQVTANPRLALRTLEESREWIDQDWSSGASPGFRGSTQLPSVEQIQAALPPATAFLEVTLLEHLACLWLVTGEGFYPLVVPVERVSVEAGARQLRVELQRGGTGWLAPARQLWDVLLSRVVGHLDPGGSLVVAADGVLTSIPWDVLRTVDGSLALERFAVSTAPSARVFVEAGRRHLNDLVGTKRFALILAARLSDASRAELTATAAEAKELVALHRGDLLDAARLSKSEILSRLRETTLLHFAGHSIGGARTGEPTQLLLLDSASQPVILTSQELAAAAPKLELVVLSACSTARPDALDPLGNLVRPLLGAGIPAVIGSLWDVPDLATQELMKRLHGELATRVDPALALRRAKSQMLRSGRTAMGETRGSAGWVVIAGAPATH